MTVSRFTVKILIIACCLAQIEWLAAATDIAVTGQTTDENGRPMPGVTVVVEGPVRRAVLSGNLGIYVVPRIPPGTYVVTANMPGYVALTEEIEVIEEETVEVDFQLSAAFEGTVVVMSSSRSAVALEDSPTTTTVIDRDTIETSAAQQVGDLLRSVPGVNVVQASARDINVASRQASPFLTGSQLAMVDGRPLYFDFFNVILWDLLSVGASDAEQIEVVRGPASAMWGANATTGVVNLITRAPRDSLGLQVDMSGGVLERSDEFGGAGGMSNVNVRWADVINDRMAYRISAGYHTSAAFERPTGTLPVIETPLDSTVTVGGGSFDDVAYKNQGTAQPRFDLRLDQELASQGRLSYSAGFSGTQGIIHTPIGPFDMQNNTRLAYGQARYERGGLHASVFANLLRGDAPALISLDGDGNPLVINFTNNVYDVDIGWRDLYSNRHLMSFGGNLRFNTFDITIAPDAGTRRQAGFYVQDEIDLHPLRLALALRADEFSNLDKINISPRLALMWTPINGHSFKLSYSRAFRAPSAIENNLDIFLIGGYFPVSEFDPRLEEDFPIVVNTLGNPDLEAEVIDAFELGYSAVLGQGRTFLDVNVYRSETDNLITNNPPWAALEGADIDAFYSSENPPPGWPLHPIVLDFLEQMGIRFPARTMMLNIGSVRNQGAEISLVHRFRNGWTTSANYSYQDLPKMLDPVDSPLRPKPESVSTPPQNRANFNLLYTGAHYLGNLSVNYSDEAYFGQGLDPTYLGYSDAYTLVNGSFGKRWMNGAMTTTVRVLNLFDDAAKQHVFGDILRRTIILDLRFNFRN